MTPSDVGHAAAQAFAHERPRLVRLASRVLADPVEAEDVVQQAWLRLHGREHEVQDLPAWLTTVTTRLCLDRLRRQVPDPVEPEDDEGPSGTDDPADVVALAGLVGVALQVVLERLTPSERVAVVLHDSLGHDFPAVAGALGTTPAAARKLASRARARLGVVAPDGRAADWVVVDAFLAAARGGDSARLLELLAPDVVVTADAAAAALGSPERVVGRAAVASFFDGAARSALPCFVGRRPGAAWSDRGTARVAFDVTVEGGRVAGIAFRAAPEVLATVRRRRDGDVRD